MARPTKLDAVAAESILRAISVGVPMDRAAAIGGVSQRTLRRWLDRGRDSNSGEYYAFYKSVAEAQGKLMARLLAVVDKAAIAGDWRAASWKLSHLFPKLFGEHKLEITGADGAPIETKGELKLQIPKVDTAAVIAILRQAGVADRLAPRDPADGSGTP